MKNYIKPSVEILVLESNQLLQASTDTLPVNVDVEKDPVEAESRVMIFDVLDFGQLPFSF